MSAQVSSLISMSVKLPAAGNVYATKGATTGVASLSSGLWVRHYLASSASAGTAQTAAKEAGAALQAALNAVSGMSAWSVRFRSDARYELCNTASSYSLAWDGTSGSNYILRDLFGFTGNVSGSAGVYTVADFGPYGVVSSIGRSDPAGWVPEVPMAASAIMLNGVAYGFSARTTRHSRTCTLLFHPYRTDDRTAGSFTHTPWAHDPAYWQVSAGQALAAGSGRTVPYGVLEWLLAANGRELGVAFSPYGFDQHVSGATTQYDVAYLDYASVRPAVVALASANWSAQRHVQQVKFSFAGIANRA